VGENRCIEVWCDERETRNLVVEKKIQFQLSSLKIHFLLAMSLNELVLTSTPAHSPLPLTSLYNPQTGQLVYSFKSPPQPSTTTTTTSTKGKEPESSQQHAAQTMSFVQGSNGVGPVLFGLGGKDGRAMLNVWNLTRVRPTLLSMIPCRESTELIPEGERVCVGIDSTKIDSSSQVKLDQCFTRW